VERVKGFKVFNPDWTCRDFKYEVGQTYETDNKISLCSHGFHFCQRAVDCFNYYGFNPENKVAEVDALGEVENGDDKSVTNKIKIVREIPWSELLEIVNTGKGNAGIENTGDRNTGDRNTGHRNTGHWNTGHWNTGHSNTGDSNTGHWNTGDSNTGDSNTGHRNTGHWNTGHWNTGHWNTGHSNTGDFNGCDCSAGVFCTKTPKTLFFDKPSKMTLEEWRNSEAYYILLDLRLTEWVDSDDMTDDEKKAHPTHETTGGYLKSYTYQEAWKNLWDSLTDKEKKVVQKIPNFNKDKFNQITGLGI
jgi:hypothetical protein